MNNGALTLLALLPLITFTVISEAFAETSTPYDEWDFDIISERFTVTQDSNSLETMIIKVPVRYSGEFPTGITNMDIVVTDPTGEDHTFFGETRALEIGHSQVVEFKYKMYHDGIYTVDVYLKSPSELHKNWPFDDDAKTLEIEPNGLLKKLDTRGIETGLITSYFLGNPLEIKFDEVVHAKISLPENHNFEKIALVNGEFVKEYGTDVKDIYIDGEYDYDDMKIKLVQYGNLLPMAEAQENLQEYVVFYAMDQNQCYNTFCVLINHVEEKQEFPYLILVGVSILGAVAFFVIKKRPTRAHGDYSANYYIHGTSMPLNEK